MASVHRNLGTVTQKNKCVPAWREQEQNKRKMATYRTIEHAVSLVSALFDMILQGARVERLQQFKGTQELSRNRHDCTPVVKFTAVLQKTVSMRTLKSTDTRRKDNTYIRRRKHSDQDTILIKFITILHDHVRSTDQIKVMFL